MGGARGLGARLVQARDVRRGARGTGAHGRRASRRAMGAGEQTGECGELTADARRASHASEGRGTCRWHRREIDGDATLLDWNELSLLLLRLTADGEPLHTLHGSCTRRKDACARADARPPAAGLRALSAPRASLSQSFAGALRYIRDGPMCAAPARATPLASRWTGAPQNALSFGPTHSGPVCPGWGRVAMRVPTRHDGDPGRRGSTHRGRGSIHSRVDQTTRLAQPTAGVDQPTAGVDQTSRVDQTTRGLVQPGRDWFDPARGLIHARGGLTRSDWFSPRQTGLIHDLHFVKLRVLSTKSTKVLRPKRHY